jgi:hypothetical protein
VDDDVCPLGGRREGPSIEEIPADRFPAARGDSLVSLAVSREAHDVVSRRRERRHERATENACRTRDKYTHTVDRRSSGK